MDIYRFLEEATNLKEIQNLTGCRKPCHYKEYKLVDKLQKFSAPYYDGDCPIAIWVISPDTQVETEELIYPWTSLVGFSLMTLLM